MSYLEGPGAGQKIIIFFEVLEGHLANVSGMAACAGAELRWPAPWDFNFHFEFGLDKGRKKGIQSL